MLDRAGRYRHAESDRTRSLAARSSGQAQGREQAAAAKELRAADRHTDRRDQGALETVLGAEILLAAGRDRVARGRPQDSAKRQANPNAPGIPIDPEAEEVQQLKSAAMPLLFQLREDQKGEVRSLARIIGLEKVAAMI